MMGFFDKILSAATGGLAGQIVDVVKAYFPPDMPPEKKADLQLQLERLAMERERNVALAQNEAEQAINARIREYEGTAADLRSIPFLGPLMLFARGAQRPIIGYATLYIDFQVFSGVWELASSMQESAFYVLNLLVLGFLFGERALQNVMPLLTQFRQARGEK